MFCSFGYMNKDLNRGPKTFSCDLPGGAVVGGGTKAEKKKTR